MTDPIEVRKIPLESVSDASGLARLIDEGIIEADRVLAVVGKTEGNGGVNDYTRIIADHAFREVLVAKGTRTMAEVSQIPVLWSGGTDGVLSPHATIFATIDGAGLEPTDEYRLAVGSSMSEPILPEEIGRPEMVEKMAAGVKEAMARAGIAAGADGLIVEVHNHPETALSDGPQSLYPEQFAAMMHEIEQIAPIVGRTLPRGVAVPRERARL